MTGAMGTHISRYERDELRIPKKRLELFAKALPDLDMNQLCKAWTLVVNPISIAPKTVGEILRTARHKAGLTQTQVAAMTGTTPACFAAPVAAAREQC